MIIVTNMVTILVLVAIISSPKMRGWWWWGELPCRRVHCEDILVVATGGRKKTLGGMVLQNRNPSTIGERIWIIIESFIGFVKRSKKKEE